jgi:hypothetical protein
MREVEIKNFRISPQDRRTRAMTQLRSEGDG